MFIITDKIFTGEERKKTESVSPEAYLEQPNAEASSVFCGVLNATQVNDVCSSSLEPCNEICLLTENESEENHSNETLSVELVDRPASQLSSSSELSLWQTGKRKNKRRKKNCKTEDLDEPLYGFRILENLEIE